MQTISLNRYRPPTHRPAHPITRLGQSTARPPCCPNPRSPGEEGFFWKNLGTPLTYTHQIQSTAREFGTDPEDLMMFAPLTSQNSLAHAVTHTATNAQRQTHRPGGDLRFFVAPRGGFEWFLPAPKFVLGWPTKGTLPETIMEVEYSLFVEENGLPRGHIPLPYLLDGGFATSKFVTSSCTSYPCVAH